MNLLQGFTQGLFSHDIGTFECALSDQYFRSVQQVTRISTCRILTHLFFIEVDFDGYRAFTVEHAAPAGSLLWKLVFGCAFIILLVLLSALDSRGVVCVIGMLRGTPAWPSSATATFMLMMLMHRSIYIWVFSAWEFFVMIGLDCTATRNERVLLLPIVSLSVFHWHRWLLMGFVLIDEALATAAVMQLSIASVPIGTFSDWSLLALSLELIDELVIARGQLLHTVPFHEITQSSLLQEGLIGHNFLFFLLSYGFWGTSVRWRFQILLLRSGRLVSGTFHFYWSDLMFTFRLIQ